LGYSTDEIVPHGFRAMFTTITNERMEEHGFSSDVIEKCTAHEPKNKVRAAYNRAEYWNQRVTLMQWWADFLDEQKLK
jgi:integrase